MPATSKTPTSWSACWSSLVGYVKCLLDSWNSSLETRYVSLFFIWSTNHYENKWADNNPIYSSAQPFSAPMERSTSPTAWSTSQEPASWPPTPTLPPALPPPSSTRQFRSSCGCGSSSASSSPLPPFDPPGSCSLICSWLISPCCFWHVDLWSVRRVCLLRDTRSGWLLLSCRVSFFLSYCLSLPVWGFLLIYGVQTGLVALDSGLAWLKSSSRISRCPRRYKSFGLWCVGGI